MDHKVLHLFAFDLLCLMDFNVIDQFIEHTGRQGLCLGVFADGADKHIHCHGLATELATRRGTSSPMRVLWTPG